MLSRAGAVLFISFMGLGFGLYLLTSASSPHPGTTIHRVVRVVRERLSDVAVAVIKTWLFLLGVYPGLPANLPRDQLAAPGGVADGRSMRP